MIIPIMQRMYNGALSKIFREKIMSEVKELHIKCLSCNEWMKFPIHFGEFDSFITSTLEGKQAKCPQCGNMTGCNKENMRVRIIDTDSAGKAT